MSVHPWRLLPPWHGIADAPPSGQAEDDIVTKIM
jgi:hypothetical protein